jgi:hypothetical protein
VKAAKDQAAVARMGLVEVGSERQRGLRCGYGTIADGTMYARGAGRAKHRAGRSSRSWGCDRMIGGASNDRRST